jgi:hypothetical protein
MDAAEWAGDAAGGAGETQNGALSARKRHELGADMAVREAKVRARAVCRVSATGAGGHTQPPAVPLCAGGAGAHAAARAAWASTPKARAPRRGPWRGAMRALSRRNTSRCLCCGALMG